MSKVIGNTVGTTQNPRKLAESVESPYDIAVKHGFKGTKEEWVASLKGEPGGFIWVAKIAYNSTVDHINILEVYAVEGRKFNVGDLIIFIGGELCKITLTGTHNAYYESLGIKLPRGEDGYTPRREVDYWTDGDKTAIYEDNIAYISEELSKRSQVHPIYVETIEECTDETKLYLLPDGYIYAYYEKYIERIPNYMDGATLNLAVTSAGTATNNGSVATDWIKMTWEDWTNKSYLIKIYAPALYDAGTSNSAIYVMFSRTNDASGKVKVCSFKSSSSYLTYDENEGVYTLEITKELLSASITYAPPYCRLSICVNSDTTTPLTEDDIKDIAIECPNENTAEDVTAFHKTDIVLKSVLTEHDKQEIAEIAVETVPDWAKQPEKPTYTAEEVGAQPEGDYAFKDEVPTNLSQLTNDAGYIKNTVTDLAYYHDKNTTYTRQEVQDLINTIPKHERKVVDTLPEYGLEDTLYLLRINQLDEENQNLFEEWIWVVDKETDVGTWERLGYQSINLVDYALMEDVHSIVYQTLQYIYPVGAIYISASDTNPHDIFKFGEWERIQDRFLLAASDNYPVNTEGGEASHTLIEAELPKVGSTLVFHGDTWATKLQAIENIEGYTPLINSDNIYQGKIDVVNTKDEPSSQSIGSPEFKFGGNQPHNNMPPYLAVYVWKRRS